MMTASARRGSIALIAALLMLASGTGRAAEPDLTGRVGAYRKAYGDKAVGTVAARAYGDPARPTGAPSLTSRWPSRRCRTRPSSKRSSTGACG